MKKYIKPELVFESFELSQQIASCDYDSLGTLNDNSCRFTGYNKEFDVEMVILESDGICVDVTNKYCYYGSMPGSYSIFNS